MPSRLTDPFRRVATLLAFVAALTPTVSAADPKPANRLAQETSPYLLMHAHNPVDWHPWGEEALAKAKRENKPIFLSVGYSSCYWCHVMERESFMDAEIAAYLNEHFVCIKVDREERPDIDEIYMTSVQVYHQLAGAPQGGGWPMSVFLTPEALPFFGASYFPPRDQEGRTGFLTVSKRVEQIWRENPERVNASAKQIAEFVAAALAKRPAVAALPTAQDALQAVQKALAEQFDAEYGGFGFSPAEPNRPKFPEPANLSLLLALRDNDAALKMACVTLDHLAQGGVRDHVGGGFHRYSTDRAWRIPHFEKMLYDNAQLVSVYSEAFAATKDPVYREAAEQALAFIEREMTSSEGAFFSALDAETTAGEGAYYSWSRAEIDAVLTPDESRRLGAVYRIAGEPNFEGRYVPQLAKPLEEFAADEKLPVEELRAQLATLNEKLLAARVQRPRPLCDTKIITGWNGLMIGALADAGRVFENDAYLARARRAAEFALTQLRTADDRLWHVHTAGESKLNAYVDDYAYLVAGLLALHRATGEERWATAADALAAKQHELFWDEKNGGYFFTSHDHEALIARSKDPIDGVLPAANAVTARNLVALSSPLKKPEYLDRAEQTLQAFAGYFKEFPAGMPTTAVALHELRAAQGK